MKFEIDKTYTNNLGAKVALLYRTGNNLAFIGAMGVYYTDLEGQCADSGKSVQPPLKFEIGKHYTTKLCHKVRLDAIVQGRLVFKAVEHAYRTTMDGKSVWGHMDVVGEWKEPQAPLKLEVGKYYKTRGGHRAQVVSIGTPHISHNVVVITFEQATPVTRTYTSQGQWAVNLQESSHDLIAEYPWPKSEKLKPLEKGDIVVATAKSGRKVVRVFAGYSGEEPTTYNDGYFEGLTAGNWSSVELLMKGKDA